MSSLFYTICMVALWVVNLFNGTGLGYTYKTTEIAILVCTVVAIICLASQTLYDGDLMVRPRYFYTIVPLFLTFAGTLYFHRNTLEGLRTLWPFMLVYILSKSRPNETAFRMTAICYAVLGLVVLWAFSYTDILKGWNPNSIAMIGLFSFLIFTIPFFGMREWRSFVMMPLVAVAYVILLAPTDSRSCMLVIFIQLLLVLRIIPTRKLLDKPKALVIILLVPLLVAIFVVLLAKFGDTTGLTQWSYETFNKPLFNGRDETWMEGFRNIFRDPLFGNGRLNTGIWHNSAMAALCSIGIVGYVLWVRMFYLVLKEGMPYLDDICINGSIVAFLALYCHQSVELGIYSIDPSLLPYLILGMMLGRVNRLRSEEKWKKSV